MIAAREELEAQFQGMQAQVEEKALALTPEERVRYLESVTFSCTEKMMDRWQNLAHTLIVKYNDQPGGWNQSFYDAVARETGNRYLVPGQ